MYEGTYIDKCANAAVDQLVSNMSEYSDGKKRFSKEELFEWGGLEPSERLNNPEAVHAWDLAVLRFVEGVREKLLKGHMKCMSTVRGAGFEIVASHKQAVHAEKNLRKAVGKHLAMAESIQKHTNVRGFSSVQKDIHRQANQRVAIIAAALENQKRMDSLADNYPAGPEDSTVPHMRKKNG